MAKSILFIISFLVFFVSVLLVKKDDKCHNLVLWSFIILFLSIITNSLFVFLICKLNIKATLLFRAILFFAFSIVFIYRIIKSKKIQKYEFKVFDFISLFIIAIGIAAIGYYRFNNLDLYFETTDPAVHYLSAERFAESSKLIEKSPNDLLYGGGSSSTMFLGYTTIGTVFQILQGLNQGISSKVVAFILFELFILYSTAIAIFYATNVEKKSIIKAMLTYALVFLCIAGYPFNNLIFGFHYLGISILIGILCFDFINDIIDFEKKWYYMIIIAMFTFSIFTSYYMFVPIFFGSLGVYFLSKCFIEKKIKFKLAFEYILFGLVISFLAGMYYYFIRNYIQSTGDINNVDVFKIEGYIYRNLIGNFVILLPLVIYKIILDVKIKKISSVDFAFIFTIIYILILFVFFYNDAIASYYYYKLYYILWPICFIIIGTSINENNPKINGFAISCSILLLLLAVFQIKDIDDKLYNKNPLLNNVEFSKGIEDIYWFNKNRCNKSEFKKIYTIDELNNLEKIYLKNRDKLNNENVYMYAGLFQKLWFYSTVRISPLGGVNQLNQFYLPDKEENEILNSNNIKYLICMKETEQKCNIKGFKKYYVNADFVMFERK